MLTVYFFFLLVIVVTEAVIYLKKIYFCNLCHNIYNFDYNNFCFFLYQ